MGCWDAFFKKNRVVSETFSTQHDQKASKTLMGQAPRLCCSLTRSRSLRSRSRSHACLWRAVARSLNARITILFEIPVVSPITI